MRVGAQIKAIIYRHIDIYGHRDINCLCHPARDPMKLMVSIFCAGMLFGAGLVVSGMTDPGRVIGFLDITGQWDVTLALVMASALLITVPLFPLLQRQPTPWFSEHYYLPVKSDLDWHLVCGAAVFGIGWGISGFCPGPAIAALVTLSPQVIYFVMAMIAGQMLAALVERYSGMNQLRIEN